MISKTTTTTWTYTLTDLSLASLQAVIAQVIADAVPATAHVRFQDGSQLMLIFSVTA